MLKIKLSARMQGYQRVGQESLKVGLLRPISMRIFRPTAEHAGGKRIAPHNFREVFAIERHRGLGIRQSQEQAHADFIAWLAGLEINSSAGNAESSAHIVEMILLRIRRTDAHELGDFASASCHGVPE